MRAGGTSGRQRAYDTVGQMQAIIDDYFDRAPGHPMLDSDGHVLTDKHGQPVMIGSYVPTMSGLAYELGLSRQTLLYYSTDYVDADGIAYYDTIARAKQRAEAYVEGRLFDRDGVNGAKFSLPNNFKGWQEGGSDIDLQGFSISLNIVKPNDSAG